MVGSVADLDPGSGAFWPLDPGSRMGKKSGSGSEMNKPDHISESLGIIFWIKILKFFDADSGSRIENSGSGMEKIRIRDKHPVSATLIVSISLMAACLVCFLAALHFNHIGNCTFFISCGRFFWNITFKRIRRKRQKSKTGDFFYIVLSAYFLFFQQLSNKWQLSCLSFSLFAVGLSLLPTRGILFIFRSAFFE
jgi:hypothetical protein